MHKNCLLHPRRRTDDAAIVPASGHSESGDQFQRTHHLANVHATQDSAGAVEGTKGDAEYSLLWSGNDTNSLVLTTKKTFILRIVLVYERRQTKTE